MGRDMQAQRVSRAVRARESRVRARRAARPGPGGGAKRPGRAGRPGPRAAPGRDLGDGRVKAVRTTGRRRGRSAAPSRMEPVDGPQF